MVGEQGKIDILVNNAGMGMAGPLAEVDLQAARQVSDGEGVRRGRLVDLRAARLAGRLGTVVIPAAAVQQSIGERSE